MQWLVKVQTGFAGYSYAHAMVCKRTTRSWRLVLSIIIWRTSINNKINEFIQGEDLGSLKVIINFLRSTTFYTTEKKRFK
ncbi:unnamed protein product [Lathyrus oleraceus]